MDDPPLDYAILQHRRADGDHFLARREAAGEAALESKQSRSAAIDPDMPARDELLTHYVVTCAAFYFRMYNSRSCVRSKDCSKCKVAKKYNAQKCDQSPKYF